MNDEVRVVDDEAHAVDDEVRAVNDEARAVNDEVRAVNDEAHAVDDEVRVVDDDPLTRSLAVTLSQAQDALPPAPADIVVLLRTRRERARRRARLTTASCAVLVFMVVVLTGVVVKRNEESPRRSGATSAEGSGQVIRIWSLRPNGGDLALRTYINEFNRQSGLRIEVSLFSNDNYKQQLAAVLGTPRAPDVFFNWGGGGLAELVQAGQVVDLTEAVAANPRFAATFLPTVLEGARVGGRLYGLPMDGMQPSLLFYNKRVFADAGLQPPRTYAQLLTLVDAFKARGVTPIALAGAQGWPQLMYLMYLTDRLGGPGTAADILAHKPGAWSDPAVLQAARMCQDLAKRGAFSSGFTAFGYDSDVASRQLADGKAAMHLMGTWEYGNLRTVDADLVNDGRLGWAAFPAVEGGAGDPRNVVGAPANYFSITAASEHVDAVVDFLLDALASDGYLNQLRRAGEIPGARQAPAASADGFTTFAYRIAADAPSFTLAWDQALSPTAGSVLNGNMRKLFESEITPEHFVAAMAGAR